MLILLAFRILIPIIIGYFFVTQLLIPTIYNSKLFPMFRKEGKLRSKIVDINQEINEKDLIDEINKTIENEGL